MNVDVKIKQIESESGAIYKKPFYATEGSAAMDLSAHIANSITIKGGERALIPTGYAIQLPSADYAAFVFARSGLSVKNGICLANGVGVIDSDYTGEIKVGLINTSKEDFALNPGDRIAQLVIMPVAHAKLIEVSCLDKTERGSGGFGSTGIGGDNL